MYTILSNFLSARGMTVQSDTARSVIITTPDNNTFILTVHDRETTLESHGYIRITDNTPAYLDTLNIAKSFAARIVKG